MTNHTEASVTPDDAQIKNSSNNGDPSGLLQSDDFVHRHIGPTPADIDAMLQTLGASSLDQLIESTVPASMLLDTELDLPGCSTEHDAIEQLKSYADSNEVKRSMIGICLLYTSPSPRDGLLSRMPSSA